MVEHKVLGQGIYFKKGKLQSWNFWFNDCQQLRNEQLRVFYILSLNKPVEIQKN